MGMRMYTHFKCITCTHMHTWFIHITFHLCLATTDLVTSIINAVNILQIVIQHKVPSIRTFFCFPQVSCSPRNVFKVLSEVFFLDSVLYRNKDSLLGSDLTQYSAGYGFVLSVLCYGVYLF